MIAAVRCVLRTGLANSQFMRSRAHDCSDFAPNDYQWRRPRHRSSATGHKITLGDHLGMQDIQYWTAFLWRVGYRKSGSRSHAQPWPTYNSWM